jgi:dihydroneopterin aldolase
MTSDEIRIVGLELPVRIGVPDAERAAWQSLTAEVTIIPQRDFSVMSDDVSATVDYEQVAIAIKKLAAERPRKLLETLAAEITNYVLQHFAADSVSVELRKRILPGVDHVSVRRTQSRIN